MDIIRHDQRNGARRQKGYDYSKRPVGKENVIIQNKTSMNNTLDDSGGEVGPSRSVSDARLGSLAAVSFAVIQPDRGEGLV